MFNCINERLCSNFEKFSWNEEIKAKTEAYFEKKIYKNIILNYYNQWYSFIIYLNFEKYNLNGEVFADSKAYFEETGE